MTIPFRNVCFAIACLIASPCMATTAKIGANKDTSLFSDETENSNGVGISLFSGITSAPESRRALIAFDVASAIPAGATINSVELTLTSFRNSRSDASAADVFSVHAVTSDWGEAPLPGSDAGPLGGGGTAAADGDATWLSNFHNSSTWGTPGGDFIATPSASQTIDLVDITAFPLVPVEATWSGAGLVDDVQQWLDNSASNFGWIVLGDPANGSRTARLFGSRERSEGSPLLTITYTPIPEPATIRLTVAGGLLLLLWRHNDGSI